MKALTLTQPWATLVAIGAKRIETRSWSTSYRGPIAIHAAKGFPREDRQECFRSPFREALLGGQIRTVALLPRGAVVATARLVDVLPIVGSQLPRGVKCVGLDDEGIVRGWAPSEMAGQPMHVGEIQEVEHEAAFGDYTPGRFGWLLADVVKLPEPIPARGSLGLWDWVSQ